MFDAKKLLDQFLGSQVPGAGGTVRERAGTGDATGQGQPAGQPAAIAAVLLGTGTGRKVTGNRR